MSQTVSPIDVEHLLDRLTAGAERLLSKTAADGSDETRAALADLVDVLEAIDALLDTIDLETLPDALEVSALPALVDFGELPTAIRERDPDAALDLGTIRDVVEPRPLWNAVDLVDFVQGLRRLERELEDVVGPGALESSDDSAAAAEVRSFVADVKPDATNAALQQEVTKAARAAREGVIDGHSAFEAAYESSGRGPGYVGRRPVSKNPTAVSSVPYGPLPAGISTRVSTVPRHVRGAKVDALPRIYGRRWKTAGRPR